MSVTSRSSSYIPYNIPVCTSHIPVSETAKNTNTCRVTFFVFPGNTAFLLKTKLETMAQVVAIIFAGITDNPSTCTSSPKIEKSIAVLIRPTKPKRTFVDPFAR